MAKVKTHTIVGEDASVAQVQISINSLLHTFTGTAKRHPNDDPNYAIGEQLALARALRKAADSMEVIVQRKIEMEAAAKKIQAIWAPAIERQLKDTVTFRSI